ncbi:hypothetical protein [Psychrobacillus sp. OK032]|uniref:hypothetical protein n=1 Tax=Psychrobacillus sp. OK032 TaxID=1884358 RepID=UPI0008B9B6C2|nr:hypothetical protein [Psychrobacillus sp. OK032]SER88078.1 hypothetical protein SAMN05518872_102474 [Psychrobacillus sp. OK032]
MTKLTRKQRRQIARDNNEVFSPQYNGNAPVTYAEFHGVGNERFNNKYVTIAEVAQ